MKEKSVRESLLIYRADGFFQRGTALVAMGTDILSKLVDTSEGF